MTEEEDLHSKKQSLKDLLKSSGWEILSTLCQEQIEQRKIQELSMDIDSSGDIYELVKLKAERRALMLFLGLPETMIEGLEEEIMEITDGRTSED